MSAVGHKNNLVTLFLQCPILDTNIDQNLPFISYSNPVFSLKKYPRPGIVLVPSLCLAFKIYYYYYFIYPQLVFPVLLQSHTLLEKLHWNNKYSMLSNSSAYNKLSILRKVPSKCLIIKKHFFHFFFSSFFQECITLFFKAICCQLYGLEREDRNLYFIFSFCIFC